MNGLCDVKSRNRVQRKSSLMTHGSWMPTSTSNHDQPHRDRKIVLSLLQEGSKLVWIMSIYQCRTVSDFWNILYPLVVRKNSTFTSIYKRSLSTRMEVFPCHCQKNCQRVFLSEDVSKAQLVAALFFFLLPSSGIEAWSTGNTHLKQQCFIMFLMICWEKNTSMLLHIMIYGGFHKWGYHGIPKMDGL